jgi:hypothetical protein
MKKKNVANLVSKQDNDTDFRKDATRNNQVCTNPYLCSRPEIRTTLDLCPLAFLPALHPRFHRLKHLAQSFSWLLTRLVGAELKIELVHVCFDSITV